MAKADYEPGTVGDLLRQLDGLSLDTIVTVSIDVSTVGRDPEDDYDGRVFGCDFREAMHETHHGRVTLLFDLESVNGPGLRCIDRIPASEVYDG